MTDKEKLEKIKALADKMYYRMAYLTSDTRPIRQAMDEYHQFIISEYHKEDPVSEDLEEAARRYVTEGDEISGLQIIEVEKDAFIAGAEWQKQQILDCNTTLQRTFELGKQEMKQQLLAKAVDVTIAIPYPNGYGGYTQLVDSKESLPFGENLKVLVIEKE